MFIHIFFYEAIYPHQGNEKPTLGTPGTRWDTPWGATSPLHIQYTHSHTHLNLGSEPQTSG